MNIEDVAQWVTHHATEQDLRDINELISKRYKVLRTRRRAEMTAQLSSGDLVAFNDNVRPTYLRGQTARVVEFRTTRLTVELVHGPMGKFRSGKIITQAESIHLIRKATARQLIDPQDYEIEKVTR